MLRARSQKRIKKMADSRATAVLQEPNGRKFRKVASGADNAAATAALTATLAITGGEVLSVTISDPAEVLTGYATAPGSYSDANFTFLNGNNTYVVHFEQLGNSFAAVDDAGNETGFVNLQDPAIINWANNYDGSLIQGKYGK
jgi:hypothetical protein